MTTPIALLPAKAGGKFAAPLLVGPVQDVSAALTAQEEAKVFDALKMRVKYYEKLKAEGGKRQAAFIALCNAYGGRHLADYCDRLLKEGELLHSAGYRLEQAARKDIPHYRRIARQVPKGRGYEYVVHNRWMYGQ
jgi:hypothetical protein